jgi:hypothetical protein
MEATSAAGDASGTGAVGATSRSTLAGSVTVETETRTPADLRKVNIAMNSRCKRRGKREKKNSTENRAESKS